MPVNTGTKPLIDAATMVGLTMAITLFSTYIPLLGLATIFFVPMPLIVLQVRHGLRLTLLATGATALLTIAFLGLTDAFLMYGGFWLIALGYGLAIRRRMRALTAYLVTAVATTVALVATWAGTLLILGQDSVAQAGVAAGDTLKEFIRAGGARLTPAQVEMLQQQATIIADLTHKYVLAMLIAAAVVLTLIEYFVAASVLPRVGIGVPQFPAFSRWRLPLMPILLVWAVSLVVVSAAGRFPALSRFVPLASNLFSLCSIAFILEGLAVAYFYLTVLRVPVVLRVLVVLLLFGHPVTSRMALWFGIFDYLFDYRRLRAKPAS